MSGFIAWVLYGVAVLYLAWRLGRWDWVRTGKVGRGVLVLGGVIVLPLALAVLFLTIPLTYWVVMPASAWLLGRDAWRHTAGRGRWAAMSALAVSCAWLGWEGGVNKLYYDMQVNRLCRQDGGVKVYEQVRLPAELYDAYARRNWILPERSQAKPSDQHFIDQRREHLRTGQVEVWRSHDRIVRRADEKVLGEDVSYSRRGGDLPGPWHPSSFRCPQRDGKSVETLVFVREDGQ